jgi:hypothetical protein
MVLVFQSAGLIAQNKKWSVFMSFKEALLWNTPYPLYDAKEDLKLSVEAGFDKKINSYFGLGLSVERQSLVVNNSNAWMLINRLTGIAALFSIKHQIKANFIGFKVSPFFYKKFDFFSLYLRPSFGFYGISSAAQMPVTITDENMVYQNEQTYVFKNTLQAAAGVGLEYCYHLPKNFSPFLVLHFTGTYTNKRQNEIKTSKKIPLEDIRAYEMGGDFLEGLLNVSPLQYGPYHFFQLGIGLRYGF